MNLLKFSKYILLPVLCIGLLTACDSSDTPSSLADAQQQMMQPMASIWEDMGKQFQLTTDSSRPEVLAQIEWLQANKDWLYPTLKASAPYLGYVLAQTQKRNLPAELALLPMLESDCDPVAQSKAGARGLWQLMPDTATDLGLKNSSDYDGRKDVVASTDAALAYLHSLHKMFANDWLLAIAAYDYGPHNIQLAIQQQTKWYQKIHFWNLSLPSETKIYVPKLLALAAIIRDPDLYGFVLPEIDNTTHLASVKVESADELKEIIQSVGVSIETLKQFNPAYHNLAISTNAPNTFLIPVENAALVLRQTATTDFRYSKSIINTLLWDSKALMLALTSNTQKDRLALNSS